MKHIRVLIERASNGRCCAYMPDDNDFYFRVIGAGNTPLEAKDDFLAGVESLREDYEEVIEELEFVFYFDMSGLLSYLKDKLTLAELSRITDLTQSELMNCIMGHNGATARMRQKINQALGALGEDWGQVQLF